MVLSIFVIGAIILVLLIGLIIGAAMNKDR